MSKRDITSDTVIPRSTFRTHRILPSVPPTPIQHTRTSLPQIPWTPSVQNLTQNNAISTPELNTTSFASSEKFQIQYHKEGNCHLRRQILVHHQRKPYGMQLHFQRIHQSL